MPNLNHDAQHPSDILGRPIAEGDIVAWGTNYGRSAALSISKITKIRFTKRENSKNKEVPQFMAEDYQLYLQPIKTTGGSPDMKNKHSGATASQWTVERWVKEGELDWQGNLVTADDWEYKSVRVSLVKNIIKLEMTEQEARDAAANSTD